MVGIVKRVKMCHRANCCGDKVIFPFFKMASAAILDFLIFEILTVGTVKRIQLHKRAKFRGDRSKDWGDMAIFRFCKMAAAAMWIFKTSKF